MSDPSGVPKNLFCVGELVYLLDQPLSLWRVQQVIYRSWYEEKLGRYVSGYGYKMPAEGAKGHYWMENQLIKPPAHIVVAWADCMWQPPKVNKNIIDDD